MSQRDTMFNERDRRCTAVQLMLSTDPRYDNRLIASTLKMQIQTVQRAQGDENKVSGYGYRLWCTFKREPHHSTQHLRSRLESQQQSVLGCTEEWGDALVQSGGRWQTLDVARGLGAGSQVQRDSSPDLNLLDYFVWSYVENITNMTSHNTKASLSAAIRRVFTELPPALVEKACS